MTVDPSVVPGLLFLLAELAALAAVGYVVVRVGAARDRRPGRAGAGSRRRTGYLGRRSQSHYVCAAGDARGLSRAGYSCWRWRPSWSGAAPEAIRPRLRVAAAILRLRLWRSFGSALASQADVDSTHTRFTLGCPHRYVRADSHRSCPGTRASPAPYHYGVDMLVGLLAPPFGPDLAFMMEMSGRLRLDEPHALVVITALHAARVRIRRACHGRTAVAHGRRMGPLERRADRRSGGSCPRGPPGRRSPRFADGHLLAGRRVALFMLCWPTSRSPHSRCRTRWRSLCSRAPLTPDAARGSP